MEHDRDSEIVTETGIQPVARHSSAWDNQKVLIVVVAAFILGLLIGMPY